mgnify:CR=1 FL=1|tara:strand:- start:469 stop:1344 length:876 start_codon:yes stop_codon:yes gene_type:complete
MTSSFLKDYFKERKAKILKTILFSLLFFVILSFFFLGKAPTEFIAKISINGVIFERDDILSKFSDIKKDDSVKAVLVNVNSPGGTFVNSKEIFDSIVEIGARMPTAVYMKEMATSGGYLLSAGAERIFSNQGTITGSIGVILQTANINDLLKKIGVDPIVIKSGQLKAVPNPLEKIQESQISYVQSIISEIQDEFLDIIKSRRSLSDDAIEQISDGRILSSKKAAELNLIDEIGTEKDAISWLREQAELDDDLPVVEINDVKDFLNLVDLKFLNNKLKLSSLNGILALWVY